MKENLEMIFASSACYAGFPVALISIELFPDKAIYSGFAKALPDISGHEHSKKSVQKYIDSLSENTGLQINSQCHNCSPGIIASVKAFSLSTLRYNNCVFSYVLLHLHFSRIYRCQIVQEIVMSNQGYPGLSVSVGFSGGENY